MSAHVMVMNWSQAIPLLAMFVTLAAACVANHYARKAERALKQLQSSQREIDERARENEGWTEYECAVRRRAACIMKLHPALNLVTAFTMAENQLREEGHRR